MKYIKKFENTNKSLRILSITETDNDILIHLLKSAKKFNVKTNVYMSKTNALKDYLVTFPDIYRDGNNNIDTSTKYYSFINSGYYSAYYVWSTILYINNNYTFIGNTEEEIELYLTQNKYNL